MTVTGRAGPSGPRTLARRMSGGRSFIVDEVKELGRVFHEIVEELSHQYLLSYASSNEARDGSWRKIQVEVTDKTLRVRHRQGYRAPGGKRRQ